MEKTSSRISLTKGLVELFKKTPPELIDKVVYLIQGKLAPDYESLDLGLRRLTKTLEILVIRQDI